jgi:hypothetical protein
VQHDGGVIRAVAVAVVAGMFALSGCSASSAQLGRNEAIFVCKQVQHAEKINPNDPHEVADEVVFFAGTRRPLRENTIRGGRACRLASAHFRRGFAPTQ